MPLTYRGGDDLEPPARALLGVGVVRPGIDAVIPVRRGLRLNHQRWRVGVGRVRRREPEGIPEEGGDPEAECRPHESEIAEEAEPVEAVEAVEVVEPLVAAAEPAPVELVPAEAAAMEPAAMEPPIAAVEPGRAAAVQHAPTAAMEPAATAAVG